MRLSPAILAAAMVLGMPSCGTVHFYSQALRGQCEIQRKARPIEDVLLDASVPPRTWVPLGRILELRRYAIDSLDLPDNQSYTTYADLGRDHLVWVVFAADEFSVEPKTWWYPLVGSLAYRGYFSEPPARALAARLAADGLETHVGEVDAYSTLGLLRDPVLNTFVHRGETEVAELIFHELTHQRLYLAGDTEFNEALATAYAEHGVRRWLSDAGRHRDLDRYVDTSRARRAFIALALETRGKLAASYAATDGQPLDVRRAAKQAILRDFQRAALRLQREYPQLKHVDRFFEEPVTNARLATLATYYDLVPGFESLLERHPGNPDAFFAHVEELGRRPKADRHAALRALADWTPPTPVR